jgi:hypothetical protein
VEAGDANKAGTRPEEPGSASGCTLSEQRSIPIRSSSVERTKPVPCRPNLCKRPAPYSKGMPLHFAVSAVESNLACTRWDPWGDAFRLPRPRGMLTGARKGPRSHCVGSNSSANHAHGRGRLPYRPTSVPRPEPQEDPCSSPRTAVFPCPVRHATREFRPRASWPPA